MARMSDHAERIIVEAAPGAIRGGAVPRSVPLRIVGYRVRE